MQGVEIVVVDRVLDGPWRDAAMSLFAIGEAEDRFNASSVSIGKDRALFAFIDEETEASDAVGILAYYVSAQNERHKLLKLNVMCVHPSHRRCGIAKELLKKAYDVAVAEECAFVDAQVMPSNYPMLRLIQKCGYHWNQPVHLWKRVEENRDEDDLGL